MRTSPIFNWCIVGLLLDAISVTLLLALIQVSFAQIPRFFLTSLTPVAVVWLVHVVALPAVLHTPRGARMPGVWLLFLLVPLLFISLMLVVIIVFGSAAILVIMQVAASMFSADLSAMLRGPGAALIIGVVLAGAAIGCLVNGLRHDLRAVSYSAAEPLPRLRADALGGGAAMLVAIVASLASTHFLPVAWLDMPGRRLPWWIGMPIWSLSLLPHLVLTAPKLTCAHKAR